MDCRICDLPAVGQIVTRCYHTKGPICTTHGTYCQGHLEDTTRDILKARGFDVLTVSPVPL